MSAVNFMLAQTLSAYNLVIAIENLVSRLHCIARRMHISHVHYGRRRRRRRRVAAR